MELYVYNSPILKFQTNMKIGDDRGSINRMIFGIKPRGELGELDTKLDSKPPLPKGTFHFLKQYCRELTQLLRSASIIPRLPDSQGISTPLVFAGARFAAASPSLYLWVELSTGRGVLEPDVEIT